MLNTALGNTRPEAIEVFPDGTLTIVRVIGATGRLASSTDGGRSFTAVPGAAGGLGDCENARHLAALPRDRNVLATWVLCAAGDWLATSRNGARSWNAVRGPAWDRLECRIENLVVTACELLVTCDSQIPWVPARLRTAG